LLLIFLHHHSEWGRLYLEQLAVTLRAHAAAAAGAEEQEKALLSSPTSGSRCEGWFDLATGGYGRAPSCR